MNRTTIFIQILLCITLSLFMLFMTSCQKDSDIIDMPHRSLCEVIDEHLYEKAWTWVEENSLYKDITIFHKSTLERILLYQNDTISHYNTSYQWLDNCMDFEKMDSHPEVNFRIKTINSETMILNRFFEKENAKDLQFEIN